MVSVGGLASGLDTASIVSQLLELERRPIQQLERQVARLTTDQGRYTALQPSLNALSSAAAALANRAQLLQPQIRNSNPNLATVTATSDAISAQFDLQVTQLAQAGRRASQGFADTDSTSIAAGPGSFAVRSGATGAVLSVAVDASTTMRDLANAINALDGDVSASIVNDGTAENANRLVLTSSKTGRANDLEVVTNGTTLQFDATVVEAAVADDGNDAAYTGVVTSAGTYTGSDSKTFIVEIMDGGAAGAATYRVSSDGGITFDDNGGAGYTTSTVAAALGGSGEGVELAFSDSGTLTAGDRFTVDVTAPVLQTAADAVFTLNGIQQTRSSNTVTDAVEGLTITLRDADPEERTTFSVQRDNEQIIAVVESFVEAYNEVVTGIRDQQQFDPTTQTGGPLLGDPTANRIISRLRGALNTPAANVTSGPRRLADLGIETQSNGGVSLDRSRLEELLEADRTQVLDVLASAARGSSNEISVASRGSEVAAGSYRISVTTPGERARVEATAALTGSLTAAEVLTFNFSNDQTSDDPSTDVFTVSLEAGDSPNRVVARLNSAFQTQGVALSAKLESDTLVIESDFGADFFLSVQSDRAAGAGTTQIGTAPSSDTGVDIVGTIGGVLAEGRGSSLTGTGDLEGLVVDYTGAATGVVGTADLTTGLAQTFQSAVDGLVTGDSSLIGVRNRALQDQIDRLNDQLERKNDALERTQARLESEFAALEVTLSQLQSQSTFLTNQLAQFSAPSQG
jgi:flagellar hook-associated protein 2